MKKCPYCRDRFNWEGAVPSHLLSVTVAKRFPFPDMVHMRRWYNSRIENYQQCKVMKDIEVVSKSKIGTSLEME